MGWNAILIGLGSREYDVVAKCRVVHGFHSQEGLNIVINTVRGKSVALACCVALVFQAKAQAASFLTFIDDYAAFSATVGANAVSRSEDFATATDGALVGASGSPDEWNGFTASVYGVGIPGFGPSKYCLDLSSGACISWNTSTPAVAGIYGSVDGPDIGISFKPSSNTIAGFSFDFIDWNDLETQRSKFIIVTSDGSQTVVTGPANPNNTPPQNFAVTLSEEDLAAGKYITEIRLIGEDGLVEVVGIYNFIFLTNPLLETSLSVLASVMTMSNSPALGNAAIIDAHPSLLALFSSAQFTTDAQISDAVSQTLPLLTGNSVTAVQSALRGISRVVQARIESNLGMSSGEDFLGDKRFWLKPFGSWADQNNRKGVSGFDAETWGMALGADTVVNNQTRLGAAFAYANSNVDSSSTIAPQSMDVDVYQLVGYGSHSLADNLELSFQVDAGMNKNKGSRIIAFTSTRASADYDSYTAHVGAGLARAYPLDAKTTLTPSVRADYTWIKDKSYREAGAGLLNLDVSSRTTEELVLAIDGKLTHGMNDATTLTANVGVGYDVINEDASITAAFAGAPGASFVTRGIDPDPWIARAGLGLVHTLVNSTEITARYDIEAREGFTNQTASVKARWAF